MTKSFWAEQRLLVLAPHPDDEVLGCGGLMSKVKSEGGEVYVYIATVGDQVQYGTVSNAKKRQEEIREVMGHLKVDDYDLSLVGDEYHLKLDTLPKKTILDSVEKESKVSIDKIKPTIVALPTRLSTNQDHTALFDAGFTACRPRPMDIKHFPRYVISYEQPDILWSEKPFQPTFYVDITEHLDNKIKALSYYESQVQKEPHARSLENVRRFAEFRGKEICVGAAEAFFAHRVWIP